LGGSFLMPYNRKFDVNRHDIRLLSITMGQFSNLVDILTFVSGCTIPFNMKLFYVRGET
jgi:hypothetical protein